MQGKESEDCYTDCRELFSQLPDNFVDLILTDLPYGIQYVNHFKKSRHKPIQGDTGIDYDWFASECYRVLKYITHTFLLDLISTHLITTL